MDQLYVYAYPLFLGFPSHLGHHRALSREEEKIWTQTHRWNTIRTHREDGQLKRVVSNQFCWHLDLGLRPSGNVRKLISCVTLLWQPWQTNTVSVIPAWEQTVCPILEVQGTFTCIKGYFCLFFRSSLFFHSSKQADHLLFDLSVRLIFQKILWINCLHH